MTRGEKTQLGWIGFAAMTTQRPPRRSGGGLKLILWMIVFMLGCWFLAGAVSLVEKAF